jgi:hypothetical protein
VIVIFFGNHLSFADARASEDDDSSSVSSCSDDSADESDSDEKHGDDVNRRAMEEDGEKDTGFPGPKGDSPGDCIASDAIADAKRKSTSRTGHTVMWRGEIVHNSTL